MVHALMTGKSLKSDGTTRKWDCVEVYHERLIAGFNMVLENGSYRKLDTTTFSGTIIDECHEYYVKNGKHVSLEQYYLPF